MLNSYRCPQHCPSQDDWMILNLIFVVEPHATNFAISLARPRRKFSLEEPMSIMITDQPKMLERREIQTTGKHPVVTQE